jgi:hypothetical protein
MANILMINDPQMPSIVNVSQRVGSPNEGCTNLQNDVDAVEKLLLIYLKGNTLDNMQISNNGIFDAITGYCIFRMQYQNKKKGYPNLTVDGIISPAKAIGYGPGTVYTIVALNKRAKEADPAAYESFRSTFRAMG